MLQVGPRRFEASKGHLFSEFKLYRKINKPQESDCTCFQLFLKVVKVHDGHTDIEIVKFLDSQSFERLPSDNDKEVIVAVLCRIDSSVPSLQPWTREPYW